MSIGVADHHLAVGRLADGAGSGEPGRGVDEAARALGRRVVLPHDRPEPLDDAPLHRHWAGSGAVEHRAQRRDVVAFPHLRRQREQPVEHRRHHVRMGDPVRLDQGQCRLGVPPLHQHDAHPVSDRCRERECERRGVVQGTGAEVAVALAIGEQVDGGRGRGVAPVDTLRSSGGTRGVQHRGAKHRVVDVGAGLAGQLVVIGPEALDVPADRQRHPTPGSLPPGTRGDRRE